MINEYKTDEQRIEEIIRRIETLQDTYKLLKTGNSNSNGQRYANRHYSGCKMIPELKSDCAVEVTEMIGRLSPLSDIHLQDIVDIKGQLKGMQKSRKLFD